MNIDHKAHSLLKRARGHYQCLQCRKHGTIETLYLEACSRAATKFELGQQVNKLEREKKELLAAGADLAKTGVVCSKALTFEQRRESSKIISKHVAEWERVAGKNGGGAG